MIIIPIKSILIGLGNNKAIDNSLAINNILELGPTLLQDSLSIRGSYITFNKALIIVIIATSL